MEIKTVAKYIAVSPAKMRSLANLVRGKKIDYAIAYLQFEPRAAKTPLLKAINSAVSSAEDKKIDKDQLVIKEIRIDEGPIYKKQRVRSRGRADLQKRRTSHILVILEEQKEKRKELEHQKKNQGVSSGK